MLSKLVPCRYVLFHALEMFMGKFKKKVEMKDGKPELLIKG